MSVPQIFALSAVEIIGDFALKEYANNGGIAMLGIGIVGYLGVVAALIVALQDSTILMVNNSWDGMSTLIESICAFVFLGERFDNYMQYVGMGLILMGMYLMKIPWEKQNAFHIPPNTRKC